MYSYEWMILEALLQTHRGTFDLVLAMEVVEHVNEPKQFLQEATSLLKVASIYQ